MASTRSITAILAADGAGYSRLTGMDEHGTHERLKGVRRQMVDPNIKEHHGHIVNYRRRLAGGISERGRCDALCS
jgi:class 3 adenylate cyclase